MERNVKKGLTNLNPFDIIKIQTREEIKMEIIAMGLKNGNPAAYCLIFVLLYPPIMWIGFYIVDKIKERRK